MSGKADRTGLGLAIVREIAAAHGGRAEFERLEGETVFRIVTPWQRILIVDDDAALRDTLAAAVADLGHLTLEAGDGAEALAMIQAGSADAVILDLRMAGMEGLEVLRRLQGFHPPPITVLTAHATAANTIEAMRLGAVDHLTKPITQAELSG